MEVDYEENANFSGRGPTYLITSSLEAFKHCKVELKKQVFPKFLSPFKQTKYSLNFYCASSWIFEEEPCLSPKPFDMALLGPTL